MVSLRHSVYQKPARGGHMSKSLRFFDFGGGPLGGPLRREKNGLGPCFVNIAAPRNLEAEILSFLEVSGPAPEVGKLKGF